MCRVWVVCLLLLLLLIVVVVVVHPSWVVIVLSFSRLLVYPFFQVLMNAGAIPGLDITPEAALAKLAHVLSLPIRSFKRLKSMILLAFTKY